MSGACVHTIGAAVYSYPRLTVLFLLSAFINANYFSGKPAGSNRLKTIKESENL